MAERAKSSAAAPAKSSVAPTTTQISKTALPPDESADLDDVDRSSVSSSRRSKNVVAKPEKKFSAVVKKKKSLDEKESAPNRRSAAAPILADESPKMDAELSMPSTESSVPPAFFSPPAPAASPVSTDSFALDDSLASADSPALNARSESVEIVQESLSLDIVSSTLEASLSVEISRETSTITSSITPEPTEVNVDSDQYPDFLLPAPKGIILNHFVRDEMRIPSAAKASVSDVDDLRRPSEETKREQVPQIEEDAEDDGDTDERSFDAEPELSLSQEERARLIQEAPKMKEVKVLRRKGVVRYYEQMNPQKIFPLLVSIIQAELYIKIPDLPRVQQAESDKVLEIKETSPYVRLVPVIPGCIISPPEAVVDVRKEKVDTEFWISPQAEGDLQRSARVQIWHEGILKDEIPIPTRVRTQTLTKIISSMSFFSGLAGAIFEAYGKQLTAVKATAAATKVGAKVSAGAAKVSAVGAKVGAGAAKVGTGVAKVGAGAGAVAAAPPDDKTTLAAFLIKKIVGTLGSSGMMIALVFLVAALLCYWWLKPKRGDEIEHFLNSELH